MLLSVKQVKRVAHLHTGARGRGDGCRPYESAKRWKLLATALLPLVARSDAEMLAVDLSSAVATDVTWHDVVLDAAAAAEHRSITVHSICAASPRWWQENKRSTQKAWIDK